MADEAAGGGEGGAGTEGGTTAPTTGVDETADLGFYNRKLHNYPLVRVSRTTSYIHSYMYICICKWLYELEQETLWIFQLFWCYHPTLS